MCRYMPFPLSNFLLFVKVYSAPLIRKTRQAEGVEAATQHVIETPNFLMALSAMMIDERVLDVKTLVVTANDSTNKDNLDVELKNGDDEIFMKFSLSGGTWWIYEIKYKNSFYHPHSAVSAYEGDSYGCVDLRLSNARTNIIFHDIQMLPRFDPTLPEAKAFPDKWNDCTGFFSAAIWAGLFVVIILLSILTCGITMMLDIRTMDRFDDPKGKTITINAQE